MELSSIDALDVVSAKDGALAALISLLREVLCIARSSTLFSTCSDDVRLKIVERLDALVTYFHSHVEGANAIIAIQPYSEMYVTSIAWSNNEYQSAVGQAEVLPTCVLDVEAKIVTARARFPSRRGSAC